MSTEHVKRKLVALLSADVKGYSRMMGEDEVDTMRTLLSYRNLIGAIIENRAGRVVDAPGDNLLAEFSSVVEAVEAAVIIQNKLQAQNKKRPANRKMEFRIGINLGDVIAEDDEIYGDGEKDNSQNNVPVFRLSTYWYVVQGVIYLLVHCSRVYLLAAT